MCMYTLYTRFMMLSVPYLVTTVFGHYTVPYIYERRIRYLWSLIGMLICLLVAELHNTAGLLFPSQYRCGTILLSLYSMVWDCRV